MNAAAMRLDVAKKVPSDRQFDARRANALRVAGKISGLLDSGHRIYDEEGDALVKVDVRKCGDVVFEFREGGNVVYFLNDKTFDNGAMDSIADFNVQFSGWTYIHPTDVRPLESEII